MFGHVINKQANEWKNQHFEAAMRKNAYFLSFLTLCCSPALQGRNCISTMSTLQRKEKL